MSTGKRGMGKINSRSCWPSLCLTIAHHAGDNEIRVVHNCTERNSQSISQLASFVDCTGSLSVDMTENVSITLKTKSCFVIHDTNLGSPADVLKVEMSWCRPSLSFAY